MSERNSIVLYRVNSTSCIEMVLRKIIHGVRFVNGKVNLDYIQITGNENLIHKVRSLQYKGRITPECILQIVKQKTAGLCQLDVRKSAIVMPKEWCERRGVLVDKQSHGFTIFLHTERGSSSSNVDKE